MKRFFSFFALLLILVTISGLFGYKRINNVFSNYYSSEIVVDVNSGRVLYENNAYNKKYMASTTKILTAIVAIENIDLNKRITVKKENTGIEGSSIYLEEGEILSVMDLLYGLMLRSGNDCAETLASNCGYTRDEFIELMNKTAVRIGANNSNFVNPHGLHDDNHYTTAYDLALISSYAIKNPIFKKIVSTKFIEIPWTTRNYNRKLYNKNKMLSNYDGCTGIKTGYTKKAGRCLVTSSERNGLELVCVVLNCGPMWEKSSSLLNNVYSEYYSYKIINKDNVLDFLECDNDEKIGVYSKNDVKIAISEQEKKEINVVFDYYKNTKEFIKKDTEIGKIKIFIKNNLLFEEKIYNIVDIKSQVKYENK